MAVTSYSKAQSATFIAPGNDGTLLTDVTVATRTPLIPITQGTALDEHFSDAGLPTVQISGWQIEPELGNANLTVVTTSPVSNVVVSDFWIQRAWPLVDITQAGFTEKEFAWRLGIITGEFRGWATGDLDHYSLGGAMTLTFEAAAASTLGTIISLNADDKITHINSLSFGIPKRIGGPVPVRVGFQVSGDTDTGTNTEFDTGNQPGPPLGNLSVTNSGGPAISAEHCLNNVIRIHNNAARGGPVEVYRVYTRSKT